MGAYGGNNYVVWQDASNNNLYVARYNAATRAYEGNTQLLMNGLGYNSFAIAGNAHGLYLSRFGPKPVEGGDYRSGRYEWGGADRQDLRHKPRSLAGQRAYRNGEHQRRPVPLLHAIVERAQSAGLRVRGNHVGKIHEEVGSDSAKGAGWWEPGAFARCTCFLQWLR